MTPSSSRSFPSGHTSEAFSLATSLTLVLPKWYVIAPAYTFAGLVGSSRMYLGAHYPSDIIAGALVGSGAAWLSYQFNKKLLQRKKSSTR
jgi:undecaprenyl-diphosphatase